MYIHTYICIYGQLNIRRKCLESPNLMKYNQKSGRGVRLLPPVYEPQKGLTRSGPEHGPAPGPYEAQQRLGLSNITNPMNQLRKDKKRRENKVNNK